MRSSLYVLSCATPLSWTLMLIIDIIIKVMARGDAVGRSSSRSQFTLLCLKSVIQCLTLLSSFIFSPRPAIHLSLSSK
jgi:hypothetical protein